MNSSFQDPKSTPHHFTSRETRMASPGNTSASLSASEIESLLKSAQQHLDAPAIVDPNFELGPGDVQHLRGISTSRYDLGREVPNSSMPTAGVQNVENSWRETERRPAEALPAQPSGQEHESSATNQKVTSISGGLTLDDLGDMDLDVSIELGRTEILIADVLKLREGSVVALDRLAGDPVDIVANGRLIARGELLVIDGKFGVRLSEVL